MKELKVITMFSGYDSQCLALNRLGVPYDLVGWCEVDRHAIRAHNALFPQWADRNLGDVSAVVWSEVRERVGEKIDLLTYSSPCQDFSNAGKQAGGEKGSGTRSGLLWECERAIGVLKPRYLLFENVPNLVSKKFIDTFLAWGKVLQLMGYRNYWRCLNAKHYGVPQNRNRVYMVSVYGDNAPRPYYFPKKFKLERKLKDVLEQDVEERYYLSEERVRSLLESTVKEQAAGNGFAFMPRTVDDETAGTVQTSNGRRKTDNFIAERKAVHVEQILLNGDREGNASTITTGHDCASHITDPQGGHKQMGVMEIHSEVLGWTRDEKGNVIDRHPVDVANCVTAGKRDNTQNYVRECAVLTRRRTDEQREARQRGGAERFAGRMMVERNDGICNTLTSVPKDNLLCIREASKTGFVEIPDGAVFDAAFPTSKTRRGRLQEGGRVSPTVMSESNCLLVYRMMRIRRLTERELFRLMDVDEKDIDTLLSAGIPKTQLAKMAGNSIVVNVLRHIFRTLLVDTEPPVNEQLKLF